MISPSCAASTAKSRSRCGRVWWPRSASTAQSPPTHARSPRALRAASKSAAASASTTSTLEQWAAPLAADHQIRRSGQVVQDRPSSVMGWVDIPELPCASGAVQRLGYSHGASALILDRLLSGGADAQLSPITPQDLAVHGCARLAMAAHVAVTVAVSDHWAGCRSCTAIMLLVHRATVPELDR